MQRIEWHRIGRIALRALAVTLWFVAGTPHAVRAADADWRYVSIPFTKTNGTTVKLAALEVVPSGGRFPLVVISHGTPRVASDRATMAPGSYQAVARWFVDHGYAVVIPMRRGYGQSDGPYVEGSGSDCQNPDYVRSGLTSAQDIEAVLTYERGQSFVDPQRIVLVGVSAGGLASLAAISRNPPGVVAAVTFAPGRGSNAPDEVCTSSALVTAAQKFGSTAHVPLLWISSENDHFFGPQLARSMFDAFHGASSASAEFIAAPSCGPDGHQLFSRCPNDWHDAVEAYLQKTVPR
jgi:dienelactone hydrolase